MSKAKDKKLKKLKKKSIVSQLVGVFVVILVYFTLAIGIFVLFNMNLLYNKVQVGYDNSVRIKQMISTVIKQNDSMKLNETCKDALELTPNTEAICIYSANKDRIYKSKNDIPNGDYEFDGYSNKDVTVLLTDEHSSMIYAYYEDAEDTENTEEETKKVSVEVQLEKLLDELPEIRDLAQIGSMWEQNRVANLKLWYCIYDNKTDMYVCIKNNLPISATEVYITVAIVGIIGLIAIVLITFYVVSIIKLSENVTSFREF